MLTKPEMDELFRAASEKEDAGYFDEAVTLYKQAAEAGDPASQSNLGNLLDDKIEPRRPEEAVYWYKRSAESGSFVGARNLSIHYKNLGDIAMYHHWLQRAAEMGDDESADELRQIG